MENYYNKKKTYKSLSTTHKCRQLSMKRNRNGRPKSHSPPSTHVFHSHRNRSYKKLTFLLQPAFFFSDWKRMNKNLKLALPRLYLHPLALVSPSLSSTVRSCQDPDCFACHGNPPKTSKSGYLTLKDASPDWSNRSPKEMILLDSFDYEHWLIHMEFSTNAKLSKKG